MRCAKHACMYRMNIAFDKPREPQVDRMLYNIVRPVPVPVPLLAANVIPVNPHENVMNARVQEFITNNPHLRKICKSLQRPELRGFELTRALSCTWGVMCRTIDVNVYMNEVNELLEKNKLIGPITPEQVAHGVHFARFDSGGNIVFYMCLITAEVNRCFGKNIVSIEWLVNTMDNHFSSVVVEHLKKRIYRRKQKSYLITQSTQEALKFWRGKMGISSLASGLMALMHIYLDTPIYDHTTTCLMA